MPSILRILLCETEAQTEPATPTSLLSMLSHSCIVYASPLSLLTVLRPLEQLM